MGIEFEEESRSLNSSNFSRNLEKQKKGSKIVNFLIKEHIVKNETQAQYILLGIAAILLIVAVFIFKNFTGTQQIRIDFSQFGGY